MKTLESIKPNYVERGNSWGCPFPSGREIKVSFIRPGGDIICRNDEGDRFAISKLISLLKRTDGAGKGWQIDEIAEREHKDGLFVEYTYSGKGLDYLFDPISQQDNNMNSILEVIKKLQNAIPVDWDRFTKTDDGFYVVYGWIARSDGQRDFVLFEMWDYESIENVFCTTSSAKYSEEISRVLYGNADDHNPCRKIDELWSPTPLTN